jgi:hypothetical protein
MDMLYPAPNPPPEVEAPEKLTRKQAREFFAWFVQQIPERLAVLQSAYRHTTGRGDLPLEQDSLVPLWAWLCSHVAVRQLTKAELAARRSGLPDWITPDPLADKALTLASECLIYDAGIFFAEVLRRQNPGMEWVLSTKRSSGAYHYPVLSGIDPPMIAHFQVRTCVGRFLRGERSDQSLMERFNFWQARVRL